MSDRVLVRSLVLAVLLKLLLLTALWFMFFQHAQRPHVGATEVAQAVAGSTNMNANATAEGMRHGR